MRYSPEPKDNKASFFSGAFLAVGVALILAAPLAGTARGIVQIIAVCLLTASIFVLIRYRMTRFIYSVCPRDCDPAAILDMSPSASPDRLDFVAERIQGSRKPLTECRLALDCLADVIIGENGEEPKTENIVKKYNYCVSLQPKRRVCLVFEEPVQGRIAVYIEPNDKMESYLLSVAARNKM